MRDLQGDENINHTMQPSNYSPLKKEFPENYDTTDYILPRSARAAGPGMRSPNDSIVANKMTYANIPKQSPSYKTLINSSRGASPQPQGASSSRQLLF
jgi:hypothetical protein